MRLGSGT
jgi:hypothetical protein